MLKLELMVDGEKRTFTEPFVSMRHIKSAATFIERIEEGLDTAADQFDNAIALVASFFKDEKVTYDLIADGLQADDFKEVIMDMIFRVVDGETKKKKSSRLAVMKQAEMTALAEVMEQKEI